MMNTLFKKAAPSALNKPNATRNFSAVLRQRMEAVIADRQKEVVAFRKEHADTVVGEVTVS